MAATNKNSEYDTPSFFKKTRERFCIGFIRKADERSEV